MATTCRALVMLSALVGLPAAWVYYGPLPPEAQRIADRAVGAAKEAIGWNQPWAPAPDLASTSTRDIATPSFEPVMTAAAATTPPALVEPPPLIAPKAPAFADRVEPLLARLRTLGVVAYDLELFGDRGKLYRFHCEMPLAADGRMTEQFEAVAADPQESVAQVVAQISRWQLSRQHAGM